MGSSRLRGPLTSDRGIALVAVLLSLGVAGCGGSQVEYQEVPGDPAEITLPDRTPSGDPAAADTDADAADDGATATATAAPADAAEVAPEAPTDDSATAEATPAPAEDGATNDEPPVPGSDAERFEDFCEQNAGAC